MKRFYEAAAAAESDDGHVVTLDGRPIRSPVRNRLILPSRGLAEAIAAEWAAQGEKVDFAAMPLTRLAGIAVDDVADRPEAVVDAIAAYGATDLTCYRAEVPPDLAARQHRHWQPLLDWIATRHGVALAAAAGVTPLGQPGESLAALRRAVAVGGPFVLTGVHAATACCGSVVIALALRDGEVDADAAWAAAQVDEDYQIEKWGEDEEAAERRRNIRADLDAAARLLELCAAG